MEFVTNIANAKSTQPPYATTASKIAAEKAAKEGAHLRQQLSREIARKNAALKENTALRVLLDNTGEQLTAAHQKISELESKIFHLEVELKEVKAKKSKKEKKQDTGSSPAFEDSVSNV